MLNSFVIFRISGACMPINFGTPPYLKFLCLKKASYFFFRNRLYFNFEPNTFPNHIIVYRSTKKIKKIAKVTCFNYYSNVYFILYNINDNIFNYGKNLFQFPLSTIFAIFNFKSGFRQFIANLVRRNPIFVCLSLSAYFK